MLPKFRRLFTSPPPSPQAAIPDGQRVYAIGDIHGRLDLLSALAATIEKDNRSSGPAHTTIILLGDLVDRGPHSAGVLGFAEAWQNRSNIRILAGNHEEMLLEAAQHESVLRHFLRHGGRETLLSFGLSPHQYRSAELSELALWIEENIPTRTLDFIRTFEDQIEIGDYLFVHAGIQPETPLPEQSLQDLRWIREPFLSYNEAHSHIVVHGHTITREPEDNGIRIGIDTGAYCHGRLTALVLEGTRRRYLEARQDEN